MIYAISALFATMVCLAIVYLNERHGLLSCDRFPIPGLKWFAYGWLWIFFVGLALLVTFSALSPVTPKQLSTTPFYYLFLMHGILLRMNFSPRPRPHERPGAAGNDWPS